MFEIKVVFEVDVISGVQGSPLEHNYELQLRQARRSMCFVTENPLSTFQARQK